MPYVSKEKRTKFEHFVASMEGVTMDGPGDLNYLLTMLTHRFLNQKPESYETYNDVIGALESAKLELYRRHVASFSNEKIRENGDV
jgi:hypothetical protein